MAPPSLPFFKAFLLTSATFCCFSKPREQLRPAQPAATRLFSSVSKVHLSTTKNGFIFCFGKPLEQLRPGWVTHSNALNERQRIEQRVKANAVNRIQPEKWYFCCQHSTLAIKGSSGQEAPCPAETLKSKAVVDKKPPDLRLSWSRSSLAGRNLKELRLLLTRRSSWSRTSFPVVWDVNKVPIQPKPPDLRPSWSRTTLSLRVWNKEIVRKKRS